MGDIVKEKNDINDKLKKAPSDVIKGRAEVLELVQLGEEMRTQLGWAITTNNVPFHSEQLAKQRALCQGATTSQIIKYKIANTTDGTPNWGAYPATITLPALNDASYSNNTSFGGQSFYSPNTEIEVTLSGTSGATQTVNGYAYSTYVGDYFFTRDRKTGSLVDSEANTEPYMGPTMMSPFVPGNTVNGEVMFGTMPDPAANSEYRYDYVLLTNSTSTGHAGGGKDIGESKYVGNTYVTLALVNVAGTFTNGEILKDSDGSTANVKFTSNTTTVSIDVLEANGTFSNSETITQTTGSSTTNALVTSVSQASNTEFKLAANGLITGSSTSYELGFSTSNTVTLSSGAVTRVGNIATVSFANGHGLSTGERVIISGANEGFKEFEGAFEVGFSNTTHFSYTTANSGSITAEGNYTFSKNLIVGLTSNAVGRITSRNVNNSATLRLQNINAAGETTDDSGFPINNTVTGNTSSTTGKIENRTANGDWASSYTNNVKTYDAVNGTWDYDSANNTNGIPALANVGEFWLDKMEAVNVSSYVSSGVTDGSAVNKIVLSIPLSTTSDTSGGWDSDVRTFAPSLYKILPLKSWDNQTSGSTIFLEAYQNFVDLKVVSEGLEENSVWLSLGNNAGNVTGSDVTSSGGTSNGVHAETEVTLLNDTLWQAKLGIYQKTSAFASADDILRSANPDYLSSGSNGSYSTSSNSTLGTSVMYSLTENDPFFPALAGTHKTYTNTDSNIVGTQPTGFTDKHVYAGQFHQYEKGRKFENQAGNAVIDDYAYRYGVYADIKWGLGVNPELTVTLPVAEGTSLVNSGRSGPPKNRYVETYGSNTSVVIAQSDVNASPATFSVVNAIPGDSNYTPPTSYLQTGTAQSNVTATAGSPSDPFANDNGYTSSLANLGTPAPTENEVKTFYVMVTGASGLTSQSGTGSGTASPTTFNNIIEKWTYQAKKVVYTNTPEGGTAGSTNYYYWLRGFSSVPCKYNSAIQVIKESGTAVDTGYGNTYTLCSNLEGIIGATGSSPVSTSATAWADPFESSITSTPIVTDADFKTAVNEAEDSIVAFSGTNSSGGSFFTWQDNWAGLSSGTSASGNPSGTKHTASGTDATARSLAKSTVTGGSTTAQPSAHYDDMKTKITTFETARKNRITEVTNRIGYVNGNPSNSGGTGTLIGTPITNPDTFKTNVALSAAGNGGWQGYTWEDSGGNTKTGGYMSHVYAAVNVMVGKKVGFIQKIIDAIDNLAQLYNQIIEKRAKYYEFHQGNTDL